MSPTERSGNDNDSQDEDKNSTFTFPPTTSPTEFIEVNTNDDDKGADNIYSLSYLIDHFDTNWPYILLFLVGVGVGIMLLNWFKRYLGLGGGGGGGRPRARDSRGSYEMISRNYDEADDDYGL